MTGIRRLEMILLKLYDLSLDRGHILVHGKGKKDRYVPIGERAIAWLQKYIREGRPQLVIEPDDMTVFLTAQGERFSRDHLTYVVKERVDAAKLGKTGSCHLFRHTMATLMHEGGADIRYIPQMLGHEDIKTTQIYTPFAIRALQQIHPATHPGAMLEGGEKPVFRHDQKAVEELNRMLAIEAEDDKETEAVRDFSGLMARVRAGADIVIESGNPGGGAPRTRPAALSGSESRCCRKTPRRSSTRTSPAMLRRR